MNCPCCRENFNKNTNQIVNRIQYIDSTDINLNDMNLNNIITRLNNYYLYNMLNQNHQSVNNLISSAFALRTSR